MSSDSEDSFRHAHDAARRFPPLDRQQHRHNREGSGQVPTTQPSSCRPEVERFLHPNNLQHSRYSVACGTVTGASSSNNDRPKRNPGPPDSKDLPPPEQKKQPWPLPAAPPPPVAVAKKRDLNVLQKLMNREMTGSVRNNPRNMREPPVRLFNRLPGRLAFFLKDAIPLSAIEAGHIFLGFSKCGQFLLSYTQTVTEFDLMSLTTNFTYRLHWWLFLPYRRAKKVAEIMLFNNVSVPGNLHISFCQWPQDTDKVLVFGTQLGEAAAAAAAAASSSSSADLVAMVAAAGSGAASTASASSAATRTCYITVTAVPCLNACKDCAKVAESYEVEEMAAAWNSCLRLSCLDHGMTVHTSFDLVPPYPKFEPKVSLKRDSTVIVNSGNLLHSLHFELEVLQSSGEGVSSAAASRALDESWRTLAASSPPSSIHHHHLQGHHHHLPHHGHHHHHAHHHHHHHHHHPNHQQQQQHQFSTTSRWWSELRISVPPEAAAAAVSGGNPLQLVGVAPPPPSPSSSSPHPVAGGTIFSPTHSQCSPSIYGGGAPSTVATTSDSDCESEAGSVYSTFSKRSGLKRPYLRVQNGNSVGCGDPSEPEDHPLSPPPYRRVSAALLASRRLQKRTRVTFRRTGFGGGGSGGASASEDSGSSVGSNQLSCGHSTVGPGDTAAAAETAVLPATSSSGSQGCGGDPGKLKRLAAADKAYDMTDDNFDEEGVREKLSTFRKKRLAEKKYEFTDEDSENITPLPSLRKQLQVAAPPSSSSIAAAPSASGGPTPGSSSSSLQQTQSAPAFANGKKPSSGAAAVVVTSSSSAHHAAVSSGPDEKVLRHLRPLQQHNSGFSEPPAELASSPPAESTSPPHGRKRDPAAAAAAAPPPGSSPRAQQDGQPHQKFSAKFTRRFIEMDDEMVSVISGIELEDEEGVVPADYNSLQTVFHSVLPLEVHGSAYQAMAMISNSKAGKISAAKCCKVTQTSMDVELFCNDVAQRMCAAAGKMYWFCNDYDVEMVDMDASTGDVICVAVVLVTATVVSQKVPLKYQSVNVVMGGGGSGNGGYGSGSSSSGNGGSGSSSVQRHLHQGSFKFCWNIDDGSCRLVDSGPLEELFMQPRGLWHPAKKISLALQRSWNVLSSVGSGMGAIRCFTNDSVIRGASVKMIVDTEHLVAIVLDEEQEDEDDVEV